ncbi:hybrid sensor histidine kinase/response regulator transcription factor [Maribellus mangrovi]|uniref:hybrid sensor histidine kinase/response regulator transcription factor n=1 Tax=Maribellus mangrovi TaxID=3133146 RepID=UPI0030ECC640
MKQLLKVILILFLFSGWFSHRTYCSEPGPLDSMIAVFKSLKTDSLREDILKDVTGILEQSSDTLALAFWHDLLEYCDQREFYGSAGFCAYRMARLHRTAGNYFQSHQYFGYSADYYEIAKDIKGLARTYNGFGGLYKDLGLYQLSSDNYTKSAELYEQSNDTIWLTYVYLNIGGMFEEQNKLGLAEEFLLKAIKILSEQKDIDGLVNSYFNLGIVYSKEEKSDSALLYFSEGEKLSESLDNMSTRFLGNYFLGKFLFEQNNLEEADSHLNAALKIFENPEYSNVISLKYKAEFTATLSRYFAASHDYANAYVYLQRFNKYEADNKLIESQLELDRMQYQMDLNIAQLDAERKQKSRETIIAVAAAIIFLTLIVLFSVYRSYKHKQKANRLLTEMDELKTRLFSNISHELRTPLTLIIAPLEQMLSKEAEKKPSRKQIKLMRKNANAILNLVNQILDLSKIDAKSMKLELVESDIVSFIRAHFAAFASMARQKNISFNSYTPPDKKLRFFDASKLEKIINNLVSNALKFTPENGQVFCFANFPKPDLLELVIQDTGKGIQPEELTRVFDRFHQSSGSNDGNAIGTGIGLSLTKELVELMYGQISVASIVGEGTKFKVSLPLGKEHLQNNEYTILEQYTSAISPTSTNDEETATCEDTTALENENVPEILIVEDHIEISEFIRENLRKCYRVVTETNGKSGLETAIQNIPDLIISDVMMPEMDGIEMSKKIKQDQRTSHIPIILLTGKASHKDKMQGLETGVDAFIPKPFNMKELALRVEKIIEQRQKLRERFNKNLKLEPKDIAVTSADEKFLERIMEIIEENMGNTEFEVGQLQDELLMSRTQLFRKIKALTNQSPGDFIRTIRLKRAASLMDQKFGNIAQITYEVGFNNPSYFAKCFKELFGMLPSEYLKKE